MKRLPPQFETRDLRDHSSPQRIAAVWQRLEGDLPTVAEISEPFGLRSRWLVTPALIVAAFAVGVVVGASESEPVAQGPAAIAAEPLGQSRPIQLETRAVRQGDRDEKTPRHAALKRRHRRVGIAAEQDRQEPEGEASVAVEDLTALDLPVQASNAPPRWQELADQGEYATALAELETVGGFDAALGTATAEQLMLLVDLARATGQRERAVQALRRVVQQHGSDPLAPLAAWSLGNMLEKAGDQAGAAQAFAMYRALSPNGDFAEDALARQIKVAIEQGDLAHASKLIEQYSDYFPNGRRSKEIRGLLAMARQGGQGAGDLSADAGAPLDNSP